MLQTLFAIFNASTSAVASVSGIQWSLSLEPLVPAIARQSAVRGGNVLGLKIPSQGLVLTLLSATFSLASDYPKVNSAANVLLNNIISSAKSAGVYKPYLDLNHAAASQDPIASYGSANQAFLEMVAKKYDPKGVFQTECPGGFKVFS